MGSTLTIPITSKLIQRVGGPYFRAASADMQGFRFDFEDAHIMCPDVGGNKPPGTSCFGVFDGHCGRQAADFIKANLLKYLTKIPDFSEFSLQEAMLALDAEFLSVEDRRNDGSTCLFTIVQPIPDQKGSYDLTVANVGDCRALLGRPDGTFVALTEDHKPSSESESQRIALAGGTVAMGRLDGQLAVSRAVGDWAYKNNPAQELRDQKLIPTPTVTRAVITPGSYLLICCDGIFEQLSNDKVMEFVHQQLNADNGGEVDPADVCAALLEYSLQAGSTDNMTAMLIVFKDGTNYSKPDEVRPGPYFHGRNDRKFADAFFSDAIRYGYAPRDPQFVLRALDQDMVRNEKRQQIIADSFDNELKSYYKVIDTIKAELASGKLSALERLPGGAAALAEQKSSSSLLFPGPTPYIMSKTVRKVRNVAGNVTISSCSIPGSQDGASHQAVAIVPSLTHDPNSSFVAIIDSQPRPRRLDPPASSASMQQRSLVQSEFILQSLPQRVQRIDVNGKAPLSATLAESSTPANKALLESELQTLFSSLNDDLLAHLINQPAHHKWDDSEAPGPTYVGFSLITAPKNDKGDFKIVAGNLGHSFVMLGRSNQDYSALSSTHNAHSVTQSDRLAEAELYPSSFDELATSFLGSSALLRRWEVAPKPFQHIVPHVTTSTAQKRDFLVLCSNNLCTTEDGPGDADQFDSSGAGSAFAPRRRPALEVQMRIYRFVSEQLDAAAQSGVEPDPAVIVSKLMDTIIPVRSNDNRASIVLVLFHKPDPKAPAISIDSSADSSSSSGSASSAHQVSGKQRLLRTSSFSAPFVHDHHFEPGPIWQFKEDPAFVHRYIEHAREVNPDGLDVPQLIRQGYEADLRLLQDEVTTLLAARESELASLKRESIIMSELKKVYLNSADNNNTNNDTDKNNNNKQ